MHLLRYPNSSLSFGLKWGLWEFMDPKRILYAYFTLAAILGCHCIVHLDLLLRLGVYFRGKEGFLLNHSDSILCSLLSNCKNLNISSWNVGSSMCLSLILG